MKQYWLYLAVMPFTLGIQPLDKALEAGYVQSGTDKLVTGTQNYLVDNYAKPYYLDKLVAPYFVYKKRELTLPLGNGDKIKFQPDSATLSIPF
jgi:hypothetical protein